MIPKSTYYSYVQGGIVLAKGSAAAMRKLVRAAGGPLKGAEVWITPAPIGSHVLTGERPGHFGPGTAGAPRGDRPGYWKYRNFYVKG